PVSHYLGPLVSPTAIEPADYRIRVVEDRQQLPAFGAHPRVPFLGPERGGLLLAGLPVRPRPRPPAVDVRAPCHAASPSNGPGSWGNAAAGGEPPSPSGEGRAPCRVSCCWPKTARRSSTTTAAPPLPMSASGRTSCCSWTPGTRGRLSVPSCSAPSA